MSFIATQQTTSSYDKCYPQLQVVNDNIYYVWNESNQIWTATSNLDGSNFVATKQTTDHYVRYSPQFQVVGDTIYYVWQERRVSDYGSNDQIWTATSSLDGSSFTAVKLYEIALALYYPQLQVVGDTIYYVWSELNIVSGVQFWTATSNLDGSGFVATQQTTGDHVVYFPQLQIVGGTIYYVWYESDGLSDQIWTATSNLDGSSFVAIKQTVSSYDKRVPQLQIVDNKIYYVWQEYDAVDLAQIWTATSNLDGSGFVATQQTVSSYGKVTPQFQVVGDTIYYVWQESVQIWTATSNLDGSNFVTTQQTTDSYEKHYPQLQVSGSFIYYVWYEYDGMYYQIWTAVATSGQPSVYYVRTDGNDANTGLGPSTEEAFKTISHTLDVATLNGAAGNKVYVAPGIYTEYIQPSASYTFFNDLLIEGNTKGDLFGLSPGPIIGIRFYINYGLGQDSVLAVKNLFVDGVWAERDSESNSGSLSLTLINILTKSASNGFHIDDYTTTTAVNCSTIVGWISRGNDTLYNCVSAGYIIVGVGHLYNCMCPPSGGPYAYTSVVFENHIAEAPQFVDAANLDFHLVPGSPGIDSGMVIEDYSPDIYGNDRPQGNGPDRGAAETVVAPPIIVQCQAIPLSSFRNVQTGLPFKVLRITEVNPL